MGLQDEHRGADIQLRRNNALGFYGYTGGQVYGHLSHNASRNELCTEYEHEKVPLFHVQLCFANQSVQLQYIYGVAG